MANYYRRPESLSYQSGTSSAPTFVNDERFITRIIASYRSAVTSEESLGNSEWQIWFNLYLKEIHEVFANNDFQGATSILRNPDKTNLFYGFDPLSASTREAFRQADYRRINARNCLDSLARFAEAIGAIPLDNHEHYACKAMVSLNCDFLFQRIFETVEWNPSVPNPYPNEHGLQTSKGVLAHRVPQALYQAWKIKELVRGIEKPRILEIGAGLGRTAYYARELGIKDYTIVDIPTTMISQAYFLGRTTDENQIFLFGESAPDIENRIKILPPKAFLAGEDKFDLIVNVDSMTELDKNVALTYWEKIKRSTSLFWSANHEQNSFSMRDLTRGDGAIRKHDRALYWMRRGYIEDTVIFR